MTTASCQIILLNFDFGYLCHSLAFNTTFNWFRTLLHMISSFTTAEEQWSIGLIMRSIMINTNVSKVPDSDPCSFHTLSTSQDLLKQSLALSLPRSDVPFNQVSWGSNMEFHRYELTRYLATRSPQSISKRSCAMVEHLWNTPVLVEGSLV